MAPRASARLIIFPSELIRSLTGIEWVHVPYKGGPPVLTDLMTGRIQVGFSILATATPLVSTGKIKILGVNNDQRYPVIPDIPTVSSGAGLGGLLRPCRASATYRATSQC